MSKRRTKTLSDSKAKVALLREDAELLQTLGKTAPAKAARSASALRQRYLKLADAEEKRAADQIRIIDLDASEGEIFQARKYQAIQLGDEVFLPRWDISKNPSARILPNIFLRSALFVPNSRHEAVSKKKLPVQQQESAKIEFSGHRLGSYDAKVFAACLLAYHDRPLAEDNGPTATPDITTTFSGFITKYLGVQYSYEAHLDVRNALIRLANATLNIEYREFKISLSAMVYSNFKDGLDGVDQSEIPCVKSQGDGGIKLSKLEQNEQRAKRYAWLAERFSRKDPLGFTIVKEIALLFGKEAWTALPAYSNKEVKELAQWVVNFYATHDEPYPLQYRYLFKLTGSDTVLKFHKFRYRLDHVLESLKASDNELIKIAEATADEQDYLTVRLACWPKDKGKQQAKSEVQAEANAEQNAPSPADTAEASEPDLVEAEI